MYSITLRCRSDQAEFVSAALWDFGINGLSESTVGSLTTLVAGIESDADRAALDFQFAAYSPVWLLDGHNWEAESKAAWPGRAVGQHLWLTPWWNPFVPDSRIGILHNPGRASGTGEHPCTRLCLEALERLIGKNQQVADVGTGSGLLAIASRKLGASRALALDPDPTAIEVARENAGLNQTLIEFVQGSADAVQSGCATLTVANIAGTVLLHLWDDLMRITTKPGTLILSGFTVDEANVFERLITVRKQTVEQGWACLECFLPAG